MKFTTIAALMIALSSGAAVAGDLTVEAEGPAMASADGWDGLYIGAQIGRTSGDYRYQTDGHESATTITIGGFAGYNYTLDGGLLLGGEIAYAYGSGKDDGLDALEPMTLSVFDAKARVGFAADQLLVYAFGGVSSVTDTHDDESDAETGTFNGFNYGLGVDFNVTGSAFIGVEYIRRELTEDNDENDATLASDSLALRVGTTF